MTNITEKDKKLGLQIKDFRENILQISQEELGEKLGGVGRAFISQIEKGLSKIPKQKLQILIDKLNFTIQEDLDDGYITIDHYPDVFGSCGSGTFIISERKERLQLPESLFIRYSKVKQYSLINARGDSMQPFIISGDKLIIEHHNGEQIHDNSIYVFCYENELFVKRLAKNLDVVMVKSDNPDYGMRQIEKENLNSLHIIGEIVGVVRNLKG